MSRGEGYFWTSPNTVKDISLCLIWEYYKSYGYYCGIVPCWKNVELLNSNQCSPVSEFLFFMCTVFIKDMQVLFEDRHCSVYLTCYLPAITISSNIIFLLEKEKYFIWCITYCLIGWSGCLKLFKAVMMQTGCRWKGKFLNFLVDCYSKKEPIFEFQW